MSAKGPSILEESFCEHRRCRVGRRLDVFAFPEPVEIRLSNAVPLAHKLLDLVFNHGENFYGFRGIRSYKDRFNPEWEPIYVASPGSWRLPFVTADVTRVVSSRPDKPRVGMPELSLN